ncbi:hypothetical protein FOA52_005929 [Chlamydomonas sp. UWO 241]|nr:hypothetical protein FOA52_005929 [Chlamydomonas sp. UWO 241]
MIERLLRSVLRAAGRLASGGSPWHAANACPLASCGTHPAADGSSATRTHHARELHAAARVPVAWALPSTPAAASRVDGTLTRAWGPCVSFAAGYAKGKGKAGGKKGAADEDAAPPPEFDLDAVEKEMAHARTHLTHELSNIRAGRATPGLLEPVMVEANNERLALRNFGQVTQRSNHLLVVALFNQADAAAVVKAIQESPLELQARLEGKEVHVPVPRPSMEMLARMSKLAHQEAESAKATGHPDERFRAEKEVQRLCDRFVGEIDMLKLKKDKDLQDNQ